MYLSTSFQNQQPLRNLTRTFVRPSAISKLIIACCLFCVQFLLPEAALAQAQLRGQIKDTAEKRSLPLSAIMLLRNQDSTLYQHTRAGENGNFSFNQLTPGKYVFFVSCPRFVDYSDTITIPAGGDINLGEIAMTPKAKILEMAVVKQKIAAMRWKGDTLVIKADSIKVADDASVEDLLKRIPGFQVDKNGNIKAMGEKVEKVLVDGEEFFGDDPTIATRNLDARAVNEVELFDKKSDQSVFSGVDDGSKIKTINLKLKEDRKKGYFGKIQAGSNGKELWDNSAMLNSFVGKRKISAYGVVSKTGKTGLSFGEKMNYGNTGGMETVSDGGGSFYISGGFDDEDDDWDGRFSGNGIPKSWAGGINYNNKWNNDKQSLSGSYKYGKINTPASSTYRSQFILPDTLYYINSDSKNFSTSTTQKLDMYSTLKVDSMSTLKFTVSAGRTENRSISNTNKESLNEELGFVNTNLSNNSNNGLVNSASGSVFYSRNFKKLRRNLTANASFNNRTQTSDGFLYSITKFYNGGLPSFADTIDQKKIRDIDKQVFTAGITWSEPLTKKATAQISYTINSNNNHSVKNAYDNVNGKYESLNTLNSSDFKQNELTNTVGLGYSVKLKKVFINAGNNFVFSNQKRADLKQATSRKYSFTNINPRLQFRYNANKYTNLSVFVNGYTSQPTPDQLQPQQENNDPLNIYVGNPSLKPAFMGYFNSWFNKYNEEAGTGINFSLNGNNSWNSIMAKQEFDAQGRRISTYYNQPGGNNRINFNGGYSKRITKSGLGVNMNAGWGLTHNTNFINGVQNKNKTTTYSINPEIQFQGEDRIWSNAGVELGWNKSTSDINNAVRPEYRTNRTYLDFNYNIPKKFSIGTDISYNFREKATPNDANNEITTWNANATVKLGGKEKPFTLGLYVYDILNQNTGFSRSITATGINESVNEVLQRYWMLRLTWKFAKNGKPAWEN